VSDCGEARLDLPAQPDFVGVARLALAGIASRLGFDYDAVEDVRLAVAEAMTLLLPAEGEATARSIELSATWTPEVLRIAVSGEAVPRREVDHDETAIAVMVLEALMDEATVENLATGRPAVHLSKARAGR
jgi:serine/threonine-protein kinase RsbW